MAKKPVNKKLNIREYRSQVAALKRAGLISSRIDARSHKPTRYMKDQIKKYKDVIDGKAKSVSVGKHSEAREYADLYRSKFDRVVIRTQSGERARYSKSDKSIRVSRVSPLPGIQKITQVLRPRSDDKIPSLPRDTSKKQYSYSIPFRVGTRIRRRYFNTMSELLKVMSGYDPANGGRFRDWKDYIEIVEIEGTGNAKSKKTKGASSLKSASTTNAAGKKKTPAKKGARKSTTKATRKTSKSKKHKSQRK